MSRRHLALLTVGVIAVSFSSVLVRLADAPALAVAFYRCFMAAVVLLPLAFVRHRDELRGLDRRQWRIALLSGLFLGAHFATWIPSLSYTTVAASNVLVTTQPIWVAIFGRFMGERVARRAYLGIGVALVGTLIISGGDLGGGGRAAFGDLLALTGAIFAALYILSGRTLRQEISLVTYTGVVYMTAAIALSLAMLVSGTAFLGYEAKVWLLFVLITIGPQFLGHTVFNYLLGHVPASAVAIGVMAEPVGASLLAYAVLSEVPTVATVVGGALILAGVAQALVSGGARSSEPVG
jgi:drug/metabolite transporter (DMT)-like permease